MLINLVKVVFNKKIKHLFAAALIAVSALSFDGGANAGIASIKYIHEKINATYGITVPVLGGRDPTRVTDMTYFMTTIDTANEMLHGAPITNYRNDPLRATTNLVGTTRVDLDIANLITEPMGPAFEVTVANVTSFDFNISASGNFKIDWGDGYVQNIKNKPVGNTNYARTFDGGAIASRTIKISSRVTGYSTGTAVTDAAISFGSSANKAKMTSIAGDLGQVFPIIGGGGSGKAPIFVQTFFNCTGLTGSIPADLFAGLNGAPMPNMFNYTFYGCSGLTAIPAGLFAGIKGAPADYMFSSTFNGCSGLTGTIPADLFAGINGAPVPYMFQGTFYKCSGLTGNIPSGLFAGISGAPARNMFESLFNWCSGFTGTIPADLFAGIKGPPAVEMFAFALKGCSGLTGEIPSGLFAGISGPPAQAMFSWTFTNSTGLTKIPSNLFAGIKGAPAVDMFSYTFYGCHGLTKIPSGLFAGINGAPARNMFVQTFIGCTGLTGSIPKGLFGKFTGNPATGMFDQTFASCRNLTGIEDGIWNLTGVTNANAYDMFRNTFYGCSGIASASPTIAAGNTTKLWEKFTAYKDQSALQRVFYDCRKMSDYADIPAGWK